MNQWDEQASEHLAVLVERLRSAGVADLLRDDMRSLWQANMQRYEPSELGDTARAFGFLAAENISKRIQKKCEDPASEWSVRGVKVSTPDNSLLIQTCGVDLHIMKAQGHDSRTPDFDAGFDWSSDSATRLASAKRNSARYIPVGEQTTLFGYRSSRLNPVKCVDLFLVWSGEIPTGLTAGWFGLPSAGTRSWMAVEKLWWDEPHDGPLHGLRRNPTPTGPDGFEDRATPTPQIGLKPPAREGRTSE